MKNFKKYYVIPATPEEIYNALTNPLSLQIWTGEEVQMSTEPGTDFSLWGGSIVGKNIEFIENKKIVQQWYFGEQAEESIVTIILHGAKNETSVELRHTNIPDDDFDDIVEGWDGAYFGSVIDFFGF
ncbi:activator of Hsp90 ATPase-like protein [Mucilaginibacter gracilis]|uniref:Activator of Hsp90 ATPase-like protein n=1 Tax=Mucilaginibacter gracilis TaxID=423350 RepID=A0A495J7F6_9SPHI|nr:SRPBCC domain-containing protein [Mucilaginibacter gracilis]RKR84817.1 activator of Hsp90 ATPase-like protein [Mucilaginibacter gracilis]